MSDVPRGVDLYVEDGTDHGPEAIVGLTAMKHVGQLRSLADAPAAIYDTQGRIHPEVLERVEAGIRSYPNMEAAEWLGGVAAIRIVLDVLRAAEAQEE